MIYFNELEPYAAEWIGNLYPESKVDGRSINDVAPNDLRGFQQCHFFAGIGGWRYALELAGWPVDKPVWTGSCPCQSLSSAGKQLGEKDPRHLWPQFAALIAVCRPPVIFGEQVASPLGREWIDGVSLDLEELGYTVGASDLCAASIAAPHIRQRLFWVACRDSRRRQELEEPNSQTEKPKQQASPWANANRRGGSGGLADTEGDMQRTGERRKSKPIADRRRCSNDGLGNGIRSRPQRHRGDDPERNQSGRLEPQASGSIATSSAWSDSYAIDCLDGKSRRIPLPESGIQPLAYGLSRGLGKGRTKDQRLAVRSARTYRVGTLKGYGNAIVPHLAAEFVVAAMEQIKPAKERMS